MTPPAEPTDPTLRRPALRPALRVLRRDRLTLQIGTDPQRAVAYAVTDPVLIDLVCSLDGRRTVAELATRYGIPPALAGQLVGELTAAGLVEDAAERGLVPCCPAGHPGCGEPHPATGGRSRSRRRDAIDSVRRLGPDLAAWDLLDPAGDGGRAEWERRAAATVLVVGSGRVGLAVALLLGAAGIGRVIAGDDEAARQSDRGALALAGSDVGQRRRDGLRRRLAEVAPATRLLEPRADHHADHHLDTGDPAEPDLVVLTSDSAPDRGAAADLTQRGTPHLALTVSETVAVLGPFVEPGRTACVRCLDLHRTDRDPAWPLVLDRLIGIGPPSPQPLPRPASGPAAGRGPAVPGCDDVLTTVAAAHAVLHCTTALRGGRPPSADATVEFRLPTGEPRRRSWGQHPECGCGWGARPAAAPTDEDTRRCERAAP
jgi:hypothetical protein